MIYNQKYKILGDFGYNRIELYDPSQTSVYYNKIYKKV